MPRHAPLSPSAATRWLACPGSLAGFDPDEERPGSLASDRGTLAHEVAAGVLLSGVAGPVTADNIIESEAFGDADLAPEYFEWVATYVNYVLDRVRPGSKLIIENKVPFGAALGIDETLAWGTVDAAVVDDDRLTIVDFKTGYKAVEADSAQLRLYALGLMQDYSVSEVALVVHQRGEAKEYFCSAKELLAWADTVAPLAREALAVWKRTAAPRFKPGPHCGFCWKKVDCPAFGRMVDTIIESESIEPLETNISQKLEQAELLESWIKAVRDMAFEMLKAGETVPGWWLAAGRAGVRQWRDEKEAAEALQTALGEAAYERRLLSPAAAEKALKKAGRASALPDTVQAEPAPKLAREGEGKPWVPPGAGLLAMEEVDSLI